ncbi:MAG: ParB/RepB/Spo0J family partition protein [Patescibacteria group bacterium]
MDQNINQTSQISGAQFPDDSVDNQIFEVNEQSENIAVQQPQQIKQLPQADKIKETKSSEITVSEQGTENQEKAVDDSYKHEEGLHGQKYKLRRHHESVFLIEVEKIKPNPFQPRKHFDEESLKELAASIREFGIIQPIIISKIEHEVEDGTKVEYQLIAGERRLMAAKMIGMERVPAIVRRVSQKAEQMELAIVENLQRANLNPVETARAYARLQDEFGLTQREIASRLGKSRESIANNLRILNLPSEIQDAVVKNQINESQARLLLAIDDMAQQMAIFNELIKNNLSVRELRGRIKVMASGAKPSETASKPAATNPEIFHFQEQLTELLGAPVKIDPPTGGDKGGKIVISFYSPEEIQGIIQKLNPKI